MAKEEKEKKEKSSSKPKEKEKKEKSGKEKESKKEKKSDSSAAAASSSGGAETKNVGNTVYVKHKVKADDKKTTITLWAPQGVPPTDKEKTYREIKDESGTGKPYYVLLSSPSERKWELPDVNKGGLSSPTAGPLEVEKKTFKVRKEFNDDSAKKPVINLVKKILLEHKNAGRLTENDYGTMTQNISKEYMSQYKKLDSAGEKVIAEKCQAEVSEWAHKKKQHETALSRANTTLPTGRKSVTAPLSKEVPSIPLAPATVPRKPSSPLLGRAEYIRDPYYSVRLLHRNPRRTTLEPSIESTLFHTPGAGTVKVLGGVLTKVGPNGEKNMMVAVVRDWTGAYVLLLIEPPNEQGETLVAGAYPILDHIEFPMVGHSKVKVVIDDNPIIMSFRDQDSASYLHECLKAAMCSMYQDGNNDDRIVSMRAYSVEFSSVDASYYPDGQVPDPKTVINAILTEDVKDGAQMDDMFSQLRLCLRTAPGRDTVLRHWVKSVDEGTVLRKKTEIMMNNHLRVIDEAIRHPTESEDPVVCGNVLARLQMLRTDKTRSRVDAMKLAFRICTNVMQDWKSREDHPDVPFETMFLPLENSPAALHDESIEAQRRTSYARSQVPPGIYLTLLAYHGNHVLCDPLGNLFSEVVVPSPSDEELAEFNADCPDFRWVLSLGPGNSADWAITEAPSWAEMYEHAGKQTFQFRFLHAARRLLEGLPFGTLGAFFDTPIVHRKVGTGHIVTIIRVDSKEVVPSSVGDWKTVNDFDMQLALQSCVVPPTARVNFLPHGYHNCVRVAKACIEYRETSEKRLPTGLYFGMLAIATTSNGVQILVPEANRNLPPLMRVSDDMPTIEQWRWIQSLNERKRRTGDFGLERTTTTELSGISAGSSHAAFEYSFAKAVDDIEKGTGLKVEKFYDHEVFVMDEARQIRAVFGVCVAGKSLERDPIFERPMPRRPNGAVPMIWKNVFTVDNAYLTQYFPRVGASLLAERAAHYRRSVSTCQPFAIDELCRLSQDAALTCYRDVDKFLQLISWARTVTMWTINDYESIVEANGGVSAADETIVRSIEESVEIAVSNAATNQDINVNTLKALLLDSGGQLHFSFPTLLSKLREVDRVITLGYGQRIVTGNAAQGAPKNREKRVRTYDELNTDEDTDDDEPRAPTVYEVPCTLEELVLKDASSEIADRYFQIQELVYDIVDASCVDCVDVGEVKEVGNIISDMISIIESSEDLLDHASLLALKNQVEDSALAERREFQKKWLEAFKDEGDGASLITSTEDEKQAFLEDVELDNPLASPLYYDGSSRAIRSFNEGLRVCMARAQNSAIGLENLMKVASSSIEVLDLVRAVQDFANSSNKRQSLIRNTSAVVSTLSQAATPGSPGGTGGATSTPWNQNNKASVAGQQATPGSAAAASSSGTLPNGQPASVVLVSKEFTEFPLPQVDPLRCLVLLGVQGKIRFPTVTANSLQHVATHLGERDFVVPQQLSHLQLDRPAAEALLEVSFQMKSPLLCLRLVTMLFASVDTAVGGSSAPFFSPTTSLQLRGLLLDSFFFEYGIKDWLQIELLGADAIATAMDLLWWIRFVKEATADRLTLAGRDTFGDHEGEWKKMYAETRIRVFATFGVHAISKDEVSLWAEHLGKLIEYLSFRETSVSDAEIEVVATCCANLRSIDLSKTKITGDAIMNLIQYCPLLVECSVVGCDLPQTALEALRRHATEAAGKIQALQNQG